MINEVDHGGGGGGGSSNNSGVGQGGGEGEDDGRALSDRSTWSIVADSAVQVLVLPRSHLKGLLSLLRPFPDRVARLFHLHAQLAASLDQKAAELTLRRR